jgi:hypothetical protein
LTPKQNRRILFSVSGVPAQQSDRWKKRRRHQHVRIFHGGREEVLYGKHSARKRGFRQAATPPTAPAKIIVKDGLVVNPARFNKIKSGLEPSLLSKLTEPGPAGRRPAYQSPRSTPVRNLAVNDANPPVRSGQGQPVENGEDRPPWQ